MVIKNYAKEFVKAALKTKGYAMKVYKINPCNSENDFMDILFDKYNINLVVDVGANRGQFIDSVLKRGYSKDIVLFEPLKSEWAYLNNEFKDNALIETLNYAIGDKNVKTKINVSKNLVSSSILGITKECTNIAKSAKYIKTQDCELRKLDFFYNKFKGKNVFLKVDTQGFEEEVIKGATKTLKDVKVIIMELSFVELYTKQKLISSMIDLMDKKGFVLYALLPGFADELTGRMFQMDGVFVAKDV